MDIQSYFISLDYSKLPWISLISLDLIESPIKSLHFSVLGWLKALYSIWFYSELCNTFANIDVDF